jgi:spermidine synthase
MKSMKNTRWISEKLYKTYRQSFNVKRLLVDKMTKYQHIKLFESESHGKVLLLDDVVQLTEKDEYIYHEMLVHIPMLTHPNPKKILIIGGGDGGAAYRALMHKNVHVTLVEIDNEIVSLSKKYLKSISHDTFADKRLIVIHDDGAHFVATTTEKFDIIFTDRGDPIGPIQSLFETEYYENCKRCLNKDGILVSLTGVPFMQESELAQSTEILKKIFIPATECLFQPTLEVL